MPEQFTGNLADITDAPLDIEGMVRAQARTQGLDPDLMTRIARQESGFNPSALSSKGAIGPMQLMPDTAKELGVNPHDPAANIEGGVRHYKRLLDKYKDPVKASAAYNMGEGNFDKGLMPEETKNYIAAIHGDPGMQLAAMSVPPIKGNLADLEGEKEPITFGTQPDETPFNKVTDVLKTLGKGAFEYAPDIAGIGAQTALNAIPGIAGPPAAIISGGAAAGTELIKQQLQRAFDPKAAPTDATEGARRIRNTFFGNVAGASQAEAIRALSPHIGNFVYSKLMGIDTDKVREVQAVGDMLERGIPAGLGKIRKVNSLKRTANEALDEIYNKYSMIPGQQIPGLVRTGVAGSAAAQQGAQLLTPAQNAVSKMDIAKDLADHYFGPLRDRTIPQAERDAAAKAFSNFLGDMPEDISFADARKLKQRMALNIPIAEQKEGMQAARDTMRFIVNKNIAAKIPDATDRAAFLKHNAELEKLINIQNLPGFTKLHRNLMSTYLAAPVAGGILGGASGYYTHQDPWAAAGRGAAVGAMTGATLPSVGVNLLRSPFLQQAASVPLRSGISGRSSQDEQTPLDPETAKRIQDYLNANQPQ